MKGCVIGAKVLVCSSPLSWCLGPAERLKTRSVMTWLSHRLLTKNVGCTGLFSAVTAINPAASNQLKEKKTTGHRGGNNTEEGYLNSVPYCLNHNTGWVSMISVCSSSQRHLLSVWIALSKRKGKKNHPGNCGVSCLLHWQEAQELEEEVEHQVSAGTDLCVGSDGNENPLWGHQRQIIKPLQQQQSCPPPHWFQTGTAYTINTKDWTWRLWGRKGLPRWK